MVKLKNKKSNVTIEVEDYLAGDYISTKEWELYKDVTKPIDKPKEHNKTEKR